MTEKPKENIKKAGRPRGSMTTKSQLLADRVMSEGETPLEIMLDAMRFYAKLARKIENKIKETELEDYNADELKKLMPLKNLAVSCAKDAAPFIHPRLANIEANVKVSNFEAALTELE